MLNASTKVHFATTNFENSNAGGKSLIKYIYYQNISFDRMPQPTMGNCSSKRQDDVDCTITRDGQLNGGSRNGQNKPEAATPAQHTHSPRNININIRSNNNSNHQSHQQKQQRSTNEHVIDSTRAEVNVLLGRINEFQGTTEDDKNYRYLDEMLTRCILKLDRIECNNTQDRTIRKEAIQGVNQAISILERKLEINSDIKQLEKDLTGD